MKTTILLLVLLTSFLVSCKDNTVSSGDKIGNLEGQVTFLVDPDGQTITNRSGITVQAEGTTFLGVTDSDGFWAIRDLPEGTYSIDFSKSGFETYKNTSFQFVGGASYWYGKTELGAQPTFTATLDSVLPANRLAGITVDSLRLTYHYDTTTYYYDSIGARNDTIRVQRKSVFFVTDTTHFKGIVYEKHTTATIFGHLSKDKGSVHLLFSTRSNFDLSDKDFYSIEYIRVDPQYPYTKGDGPNSFRIELSEGLPTGTKLYFKAYPTNGYAGPSYFDIATHKYVYRGYGNPSNVLSLQN